VCLSWLLLSLSGMFKTMKDPSIHFYPRAF